MSNLSSYLKISRKLKNITRDLKKLNKPAPKITDPELKNRLAAIYKTSGGKPEHIPIKNHNILIIESPEKKNITAVCSPKYN